MAAAGGLSVPEAQNATNTSTPSVDAAANAPAEMAAIPLDRQITALRTDTSQLAQRASRAQERIALAQKRIALEKKRKAAEAARRRAEALRPKFVLPLVHYRLTAGFGESSNLWSSTHTGQDFAAPTGTPIHSVTDGVITASGWAGAYGWRTIVTTKDGTELWYCHQSAFVRRSGKVKAGEVIGRVGSTGNTTGPHLHLEVRVGGQAIDPMPWLSKHDLNP